MNALRRSARSAFRPIRWPSLIAVLCSVAATAAEAEPGGIMRGTVGGTAFERTILPEESDFESYGDDGAAVSVCSVEGEAKGELGSLCVMFTMAAIGITAIDQAGAAILPTTHDLGHAYLDDTTLPTKVTVTEASMLGTLLRVLGSVEAELAHVDTVNGGVDLSDTVPIRLHFEAVVEPSTEE